MTIKEISNSSVLHTPPSKKRKLPEESEEEHISTQQLKTPSRSHYVAALEQEGALNSRQWKQLRRNLEGKPVQTLVDSPNQTPQRIISKIRQQEKVSLFQNGSYKCFVSPEGKTIYGIHLNPDKNGKYGTFPIERKNAVRLTGRVYCRALQNHRKHPEKSLKEHLKEAIAAQEEVARVLDFPSK